MAHQTRAGQPIPTGEIFVVNVMHAKPGQQKDVLDAIRAIVEHASGKPGFLWSTLAKSLDGQTVVNIEAIADAGRVEVFFSDPAFSALFERLRGLCASEFHLYEATDVILPAAASGEL